MHCSIGASVTIDSVIASVIVAGCCASSFTGVGWGMANIARMKMGEMHKILKGLIL